MTVEVIVALVGQLIVVLGAIIGTYTKLQVSINVLNVELKNVNNTLSGQAQEVRRIEERLGKLESRVAMIDRKSTRLNSSHT